MAFDSRSIVKNPAFAIGGGVCLGLAVYNFISSTIFNLIEPWFHAIFKRGGIWRIVEDVNWGCGPWIAGGMVFLLAAVVGVIMIRVASRD